MQCKSCKERVHIDEHEQHELGCRIGNFINSHRQGSQDVLNIQPRFEVQHNQAARDPNQDAEELINFLDEVQPELRQQEAPEQDLNRHGANDVREDLDQVFQLEDIDHRRQTPSLDYVLQANAQAAQDLDQDAEGLIHNINELNGVLQQQYNPEHDLNHNHGDQPQPTEPNHHGRQDVRQDLDEVHYQQALHLLQDNLGTQPRSEVQRHHAAPVPNQDAEGLINSLGEVQPDPQQQDNPEDDLEIPPFRQIRQEFIEAQALRVLQDNLGIQPRSEVHHRHAAPGPIHNQVQPELQQQGYSWQHHIGSYGQPRPIQPRHQGALDFYRSVDLELHGFDHVRQGTWPWVVPRAPVTNDTVDRLVEYVEAIALGYFERRGYREEFNYQSVQQHFATTNDPYADVPYVDEQGNPIR